MMERWILVAGVSAAALAAGQQPAPTEAPAGFDTPTLADHRGSQSKSNGLVEPNGDSYALDQQVYEQTYEGGSSSRSLILF